MLAIFSTIGGWIVKRVASWGLSGLTSLAFLGPLGPILTGIGQFIGGVISAIAEIITAMSKSYEGRIGLALICAGLGFLYIRFHYFEEGVTAGKSMVKPQIVRTVERERCDPPRPGPHRSTAPRAPAPSPSLWDRVTR